MRAMRAEQFSGYKGLKLVELPNPAASDGKVLLRMTAVGVTPLEHTILFGRFPIAKAPLVLGSEGAGVVAEGGGTEFPIGSRVMFTGPYGVFEDGAYGEWLAVRKESLCPIPEGVSDVSAAGIPVAYLTAQMALALAGFQAGKTVLAPGRTLADELGNHAIFSRLDVTSEEDWTATVAAAEDAFGPVSVLINNAGIVRFGRIEQTEPAAWRQVIDINLTGSYLGIRAVVPSMRKTGGG